MLIITSKYNFRHGFTVEGHADFDEHGKDIVCSAVSTLAQVIAEGAKEVALVTIEKRSGYMDVNIIPNQSSELITRIFEIGVRGVEELYPEYVKVKEVSM